MKNIKEILGLELPVILASKSPRRKKLLEQIGLEFSIEPSNIDETFIPKNLSPLDYVDLLAQAKAKFVSNNHNETAIIIGADTIVVLDNIILNKPINKSNAFEMLKKLSGRTHVVYTGICLMVSSRNKIFTNVEKSLVTFRDLSNDEIVAYIESGSPMDKAGSYGIQDDFGAVFVKHIEGCYYNIVGFPLQLFYTMLRKLNEELIINK